MTAKKIHSSITAPKDRLMEDLQRVIADAEELLHATSSQAGENVAAARVRIQKSMNVAKERLSAAEDAVIESTREAAKVTDEYVHENPWKAIGVSAALGLIAGMLIARR